MYKKVDTNLNFKERELAILDFWRDNNIFEKSVTQREGCPEFTFYEGPPTANGKPHIGHIITRVVKDIIPRHRSMKGYHVRRKAGWDTHGLPVELEVEKALGISGKLDIEAYGVEPFIQRCKESVWKYEKLWREMSERVGFWINMDEPYVTYHNTYIESVWWALRQIWDKGLLYRGHKVVPYCSRCGTPLSTHEVSQGYEDVTEGSVYVRFPVTGREGEYFLAWTTTPWTLPSNVALVVNGEEGYVRARAGGAVYILAEALAGQLLGEGCEILERMKGRVLEGMSYEPLFQFTKECAEATGKEGFRIVCDSYVSLSDGTGIVHTAPAFGEDDYRIAQEHELPFIQLVDDQGCFTPEAAAWAGVFVKTADPGIVKALENSGLLFKYEEITHSYPHCWRCHQPLIYYARNAWFIRMSELRESLVANNNTVNWLPDNVREGRFGSFLENVRDWSLSRERYWGTPLPIWECLGCGSYHAVGSVAQMREMATSPVPEGLELHKPYIDEVRLTCPECSGEMRRVPEVIDCWFDSGAMPFAQWHYPFENSEIFNKAYPADFISEAVDQTRGWFYSLMAISTLLFERAPFKNVIVMGHVLDQHGQKMSKHIGNVVDPWDVLNNQGADAVRWYFMVNSAPWLPSRFYGKAVDEAQRKFMGTLLNTYAFYVLYANIDGFDPSQYPEQTNLDVMDKWILSRLHTLIAQVDEWLLSYHLSEPARAMNDFMDELSNWYVRRCRERFWANGMEEDKLAAYMTLYTVLREIVKLAAPYIPFLTEEIYINIIRPAEKGAPQSIHLCDYPVSDPSLINPQLEADMEVTRNIVALGRAARNEAGLKNRQPLAQMLVKLPSNHAELGSEFVRIIRQELNLKRLEFVEDISGYTRYSFKPQLKTLGPRLGKLLPAVNEALRSVGDPQGFLNALKAGKATLAVDGQNVTLALEDVLVEAIHTEGFVTQEERNTAVVLDCHLSEELIEEGFVRELISKLQTLRKDSGFEVLDRIIISLQAGNTLTGVFQRNQATIMAEVLADSITTETLPHSKQWSINGEAATIGVKKL